MYRIIVIEDDEIIRENIMDILTLNSFQVEGYQDGSTALQHLEIKRADLILCDIMMPGIDGYEVLRKLKSNKKTSEIPFVFVTARAERSDMKKGLELGANGYLIKPFSMQALLKMINQHLAVSRIKQEDNNDILFQSNYEK